MHVEGQIVNPLGLPINLDFFRQSERYSYEILDNRVTESTNSMMEVRDSVMKKRDPVTKRGSSESMLQAVNR